MPRLQHKQQKGACVRLRRAADATGLRGGVQQLHLHRVDRGGM